MGLYSKQVDGANPEKSLLGCLVATAGMVLIVGILMLLQGSPFVFGKAEAAREAQAARAVLRIEAAAQRLAEDTGVEDLRQIFEVEGQQPDQDGLSMWLLLALYQGNKAKVPLRAEVREKMANQYIDFNIDPWGQPYRLSLPTRSNEDQPLVVVQHSGPAAPDS